MARAPGRSPTGVKRWQAPALIVALGLIGLVFVLAGGGADDPDPQNTAAPSEAAGDAPSEAPNNVEPEDPANDPAGSPGAADTPALNPLERRDPDDRLAMGAVDAPIVLVVFSDYKCPYCAAWAGQTLPAMTEYVEDGQMRIEWRDVNILGETSERAAYAAYAAGSQDRFWDYHAALYPDGEPRSDGELTDAALLELAGELGMDVEQFEADFASETTRGTVDAIAREGQTSGVSSTPAFLLDGNPIVGAQPTEVFVDAVEQVLAAHGL